MIPTLRKASAAGSSLGGTKLAAGAIVLLLAAARLLASPPDSINLSFDDSSHTLSVRIFHPTRNVVNHHIGTVAVNLNHAQVISQNISTQTDKGEQDVAYTIIDAKPGDELAVTAVCNILGKMTVTLKVPADSSGP